MTNIPTPKAVPYPSEKQNKFLRAFFPVIVKDRTKIHCIKGALSRTFFGFFSKTAPKLRLSTFNHAGSTPRT